MKIEKNKVVSFHYVLSDADGAELERSDEGAPSLCLYGHHNVMPALEQEMEGRQAGDAFDVTLPPEKAYGMPRPDAIQRVPVKHLIGVNKKTKLVPGMLVKVNTQQGPRDARVVKAGKFNVDVDTNHPLAGMTLTFAIRIEDVRDATDEEIAHRHAHGPGGHQH